MASPVVASLLDRQHFHEFREVKRRGGNTLKTLTLYLGDMHSNSPDPSGRRIQSSISLLRVTDRFDADRVKLAELYARLGRKQAAKRINEDLDCITKLAVLIEARHEQGRHLEILGTLEVLRDLSEQIGLVPIVEAADALKGALESENPYAIGATLARLRRVADRAPVGIWPYCS
jgi:hypothetical protein